MTELDDEFIDKIKSELRLIKRDFKINRHSSELNNTNRTTTLLDEQRSYIIGMRKIVQENISKYENQEGNGSMDPEQESAVPKAKTISTKNIGNFKAPVSQDYENNLLKLEKYDEVLRLFDAGELGIHAVMFLDIKEGITPPFYFCLNFQPGYLITHFI